ncbi:cytochrome-c peroxidase [Pseudoduganella eburnea]|uniref:Cytochrome-c peroxidase n=1 Tax=Massilia eburnea TaxID=1776165 RepID=A0A6L6QG21_9BURK|nr:cytochrome c peroxidase [Massilia eburnea]MTW10837.1 cytochrome-c peroxidase [Massilia eburnea]
MNLTRKLRFVAPGIGATLVVGIAAATTFARQDWSKEELAILSTLRLSQLPAAEADPSNRVEAMPQAISLGKQLFFDTRLSANGKVSCASCHDPKQQFQDGRQVGQGVGTGIRRTMPVAGAVRSPFLFWDGRKDSLWSQAIGPLEDAAEHGGNRLAYARAMQRHYRIEYEAVFGALPDMSQLASDASPLGTPSQQAAWQAMDKDKQEQVSRVLANIGKAIAAYEKNVHFGQSRLDRYIEGILANDGKAEQLLTASEKNGLRIFIGAGRCVTCHNGPLLTDQHFHNTGIAPHGPMPQALGRRTGVAKLLADEFNCLGRFSDAAPEQCGELRFLATEGATLDGAYKTPSLRNVASRAPYMHAGQLATLDEVIAHYRAAAAAKIGKSELEKLALGAQDVKDLAAFLGTLSGPIVSEQE